MLFGDHVLARWVAVVAISGLFVAACGFDDLGLPDPRQVGTTGGAVPTSLGGFVVCSSWAERLVAVELLRAETVVWSATSRQETAVALDRPVLVGDLSAGDGYDVSGPIPNLEADDVIRITSSDNYLSFTVGEVTFAASDDLNCVG